MVPADSFGVLRGFIVFLLLVLHFKLCMANTFTFSTAADPSSLFQLHLLVAVVNATALCNDGSVWGESCVSDGF